MASVGQILDFTVSNSLPVLVYKGTVGLAWASIFGTVDPLTLAVKQAALKSDVEKALGPNASPALVQTQVVNALKEQEGVLIAAGAHPAQSLSNLWTVPGQVKRLVIIGVVTILVVGFAVNYLSSSLANVGRKS